MILANATNRTGMFRRIDLVNAMFQSARVLIMGCVPRETEGWLIRSIEMEDGSGYCFNVDLCQPETHRTKTVFIRCAKPSQPMGQ